MEIDPIEMITFCIALLDHLVALPEPLAGFDGNAVTEAQSQLTKAIDLLAQDPAAIDASIDALRPVVAEMPAEDMQDGAAFCLEMAKEL